MGTIRPVPVDLAGARAALPCLARETYLNTGGAGPLPLVAAQAIEEALRRALARGRMGPAAVAEAEACEQRTRAAVARVLAAGPDEIALAQNSSDAMNRVIWGIDWRAAGWGERRPRRPRPARSACAPRSRACSAARRTRSPWR